MRDLAAAFVELHGDVEDLDHLGSALASILETARAAWPDLDIDALAWIRALAALAPTPVVAERPLAGLAITDLYLAFACGRGDERAIASCDALLVREAEYAAAAARLHASVRDEAIQIVRNLVFAPRPERPAAIHDYSGRGPLHGWLRVIVARELVRLAKAQQRSVSLEEHLMEPAVADRDPVLESLKARYRAELADAFRASLEALPKRDRTLLRYQLIDGLSIDEIATIYRVHRSTAARWLVQIRDALVEDTRARLAEALGVETNEAESIVRLVQSQLEVSVIRHLDKRK